MSDVSFRIVQRNDYGADEFPSVFARISRLDRSGRTVRNSTVNELIPISPRKQDVLVLDLEPGIYTIEVRLPTGELLADSVVVRENTESSVVLRAQSVPHEWLGFEYFPDNTDWWPGRKYMPHAALTQREVAFPEVLARPAISTRDLRGAKSPQALVPRKATQGAAAQSTSRVPSSVVAYEVPAAHFNLDPDSQRRDLMRKIGLEMYGTRIYASDWQREPAVWQADELAKVDPLRAINVLEIEKYSHEPELLQRNAWETLPSLVGSTANILAGLKLGTHGQVIHPFGGDDSSAVFKIASNQVDDYSCARSFAVARRRMGVELVCLPTNCGGGESGHFAGIGVKVRRPRYEHEFSTSVFVRDKKMALLLAFLSNGDLSMVSQLAEHSSLMLFEKEADPIAAAAGGYAVVGSAVDANSQPWHGWVENLMSRFNMPDGAIQYGMMRLRLRTSKTDVREAAAAFKLAYTRGVPIFGIGMRWLLDGLEQTGAIDEEARDMAIAVRRLSFRLHPQSPFTILRLGKR